MLVNPSETLLFIGPSLPRADVESQLTAEVRICPPVRRGDIDALNSEIRRVAIVDGVFHAALAVCPREVLRALRRGVEVWGSSSMGALRAAELSAYGMKGIGEVYRRYVEGLIDSDAEVALTFDPVSGRAVTEPLIVVRCMVELAQEAAVLDESEAREVLRAARAMPYTQLTYPTLLSATRSKLPADTHAMWSHFVETHQQEADLKRADALLMIDRLNAVAAPREADTHAR